MTKGKAGRRAREREGKEWCEARLSIRHGQTQFTRIVSSCIMKRRQSRMKRKNKYNKEANMVAEPGCQSTATGLGEGKREEEWVKWLWKEVFDKIDAKGW